MKQLLFLGDSITDAGHLFEPGNLGYGYVRCLAEQLPICALCNRGHDGFTTEALWRMLQRDSVEKNWDVITLLIGVNDIPVSLYANRNRIPEEFSFYYDHILHLLSERTDAHLVLAEPFLFDSPAQYLTWEPYLLEESLLIRRLAAKYDAIFLPLHQEFRREAARLGTASLTTDGIHLTDMGSRTLARLWLTACSPFLSQDTV